MTGCFIIIDNVLKSINYAIFDLSVTGMHNIHWIFSVNSRCIW